MVAENMYDNYKHALIRILGNSNQYKADELFKEIFSFKSQTLNNLQSLYK
jgi:hypothetical protein